MALTNITVTLIGFILLYVSETVLGHANQSSILGSCFHHSRVCYKGLGCFSTDPFHNDMGLLPESPDDVMPQLMLFTRNNPLNSGDIADNAIRRSRYLARKPVKIIIHGYWSSGVEAWVKNMTKGFLQKGDFNVIVVNWREGARKWYPQSVANTRIIAAIVASSLKTLQYGIGLDMSDVHIVGHSLGAHVAGYIGQRINGIGRITGLDPAGPMFASDNPDVRLDPTDAMFVDVIHTDASPLIALGFGYKQPCGDIDFYPNGGVHQPGCPPPIRSSLEDLITLHFADLFKAAACSHERSHTYYTESLFNENCNFTAHPCSSYKDFLSNNCAPCKEIGCPNIGYLADRTNSTGTYYLQTNSNSPFCR